MRAIIRLAEQWLNGSLVGQVSARVANKKFNWHGSPAVPPHRRSKPNHDHRRLNFIRPAGPSLIACCLMSSDEILTEEEEKMTKTEEEIVNEFAGGRTGKASAPLSQNDLVEVDGSQMRQRQHAGI